MPKVEIYRTKDEIEFAQGLFDRNRIGFRNYATLILGGAKVFEWDDYCHVDMGELRKYLNERIREDRMQELAIRHSAIRKESAPS